MLKRVSRTASSAPSIEPVTFGSVCSGIEAASVAWEALGWKAAWLSEIEPFPCAVLAHHWPQVHNLGDFTRIRRMLAEGSVEAPDVLVGGTPCQAYSVAGKRLSLDDARGQLTLQFVGLADAIDETRAAKGKPPCTIVWENVPGVLSTKDNAFGCFLGDLAGEDVALQPPGGKWTNFGFVRGPRRAVAWRILDAQYFGVAQRRRRVFLVASAGGILPKQVLFELDGVRRDSPPSREAGKVAPTIPSRSSAGGGLGTDFDLDGGLIQQNIAPTLRANGKAAGSATQQDAKSGALVVQAFGGNRTSGPIDVSPALNACGTASGRQDFETEAFLVQGFNGDVARTLTARHDSSPCVDRGMDVVGIAFSSKDHGADAVEGLAPTMRSMGHNESHANGGGQLAVAVALRGREGGATAEVGDDAAFTLRASTGGGDKPHAMVGMQVRRLTPTECERLQGFPDGHTRIPWRGKGADECPDGPRYKALGNSMAVPVMRWIGRRLATAMKNSLHIA